MESFESRLRRFLTHDEEIPLTLILWAQNFLVPQVRVASENQLDNLIFLGTHAFIQTFSEKALGRRGRDATNYFLQSFMDEVPQDRQFSRISDELHEMRNVMAHQLFSSRTHDIAIDYAMEEGWRQDQDLLHVNPEIYAQQFMSTIDGGRLWQWRDFVTDEQLTKQKYFFVLDWLDLPKRDVIAQAIGQLTALEALADIQNAAAVIDLQICQKYGI